MCIIQPTAMVQNINKWKENKAFENFHFRDYSHWLHKKRKLQITNTKSKNTLTYRGVFVVPALKQAYTERKKKEKKTLKSFYSTWKLSEV